MKTDIERINELTKENHKLRRERRWIFGGFVGLALLYATAMVVLLFILHNQEHYITYLPK